MNQRRQYRSNLEDPDRQLGQLLAQWLSGRAPTSVPASLVPTIEARIRATSRRRGWRIRDWWLWRPGRERGTGLLLVTATGVLVMAMMGIGGGGVYLLATMHDDAPLSSVPGGAVDTPAESLASVAVETPAAESPASSQDGATLVAGTITRAPVILDEGAPTTPLADGTQVVDIRTEGDVEFDDVRLSGVQRTVERERRLEPGAAVATGSLSIESDQGAWTGDLVSIEPPGRAGGLRQAELVGSGAYAGLSAILRYDLGKAWGDPGMVVGIIFPGALPDYPDAEGFRRYAPYWEGPGRAASSQPDDAAFAGLPAYVRGSLVQSVEWLSDDARLNDGPPRMQLRPQWMVGEMDLGDPRLEVAGYETLVNADYFEAFENGAAMAGISRGSSLDGGRWSGQSRGYADPEADLLGGMYSITQLTGTGSHEGLTAILFSTPRQAAATDFTHSWSVEGMLFKGEPPPHAEGP